MAKRYKDKRIVPDSVLYIDGQMFTWVEAVEHLKDCLGLLEILEIRFDLDQPPHAAFVWITYLDRIANFQLGGYAGVDLVYKSRVIVYPQGGKLGMQYNFQMAASLIN